MRKVCSWILICAMVLALLPEMTLRAEAADSYGEVTEEMYSISGINEEGWAKKNVIIYAKNGYGIGVNENIYMAGIGYDTPGNKEVYIREYATGNVYRGTINLDFKLDTAAPVITGLEDEKIYYNTEVVFTVTDGTKEGEEQSQVAEVKDIYNGRNNIITPEADGTYKLTTNGWYRIVAIDKAGNECDSIYVCVYVCPEHKFSGIDYVWNKDANGNIISCTATGTCANCGQEVTETTENINIRNNGSQSCTQPERTRYSAVFINSEFWHYSDVETKPAAGHNLEKVDAKEPTCKSYGNEEYYKCTRCSACFKDEAGTIPVDEYDMRISAKEHTDDAPQYIWDEDDEGRITCAAIIECKDCHEVIKTEYANVTSDDSQKPTCTENGKIIYTAVFTDDVFTNQHREENVSALGHTQAADDGDCTTPVTCERCNYVFVEAKEHNWSQSLVKDESGYWHICRNEGCTKRMAKDDSSDNPPAGDDNNSNPPAGDDNNSNPPAEDDNNSNPPATGDNSGILCLFILVILSESALALSGICRKQRI